MGRASQSFYVGAAAAGEVFKQVQFIDAMQQYGTFPLICQTKWLFRLIEFCCNGILRISYQQTRTSFENCNFEWSPNLKLFMIFLEDRPCPLSDSTVPTLPPHGKLEFGFGLLSYF